MNYFEKLLEINSDINTMYHKIIMHKTTIDELKELQSRLMQAASVEKENYELIYELTK